MSDNTCTLELFMEDNRWGTKFNVLSDPSFSYEEPEDQEMVFMFVDPNATNIGITSLNDLHAEHMRVVVNITYNSLGMLHKDCIVQALQE